METIHATYWKTSPRDATTEYHRRGSHRVTPRKRDHVDHWQSAVPPSFSEATHGPWHEMSNGLCNAATFPPKRHNDRAENYHESDSSDGPGCGNGRDEAGGAARAAGSDKRRRRSDSCVGIRPD